MGSSSLLPHVRTVLSPHLTATACAHLLIKAGADTKHPAVQAYAHNVTDYYLSRLLKSRQKTDMEKLADHMDISELPHNPFDNTVKDLYPPLLHPNLAFGSSAAGKKSLAAINLELPACDEEEKALLRELRHCIRALYRLKASAAANNRLIDREQKKIEPLLRWAKNCSEPNALGETSPVQEAQARQQVADIKLLIELRQNENIQAVKKATD